MYQVSMLYAHHSRDELDVIHENFSGDGEVLFDSIDWQDQARLYEIEQKLAPTLSFESHDKKKRLWVSLYSHGVPPDFISECTYLGEVSRLFGLIKYQGTKTLFAQDVDKDFAKSAVKYFLARDFDSLENLYKNA